MTTSVKCSKCDAVEVLVEEEFLVKKARKTAINGKQYELCPFCFDECEEIRSYWRSKEVANMKDWIRRLSLQG